MNARRQAELSVSSDVTSVCFRNRLDEVACGVEMMFGVIDQLQNRV